MKKLHYVILLSIGIYFQSCKPSYVEPDVCLDGTCGIQLTIDTLGHPSLRQDAAGVWHIKCNELKYFTVKGVTSKLSDKYVVNRVPLIITAFDSNFFYTAGNVQWTYPLYSYLGLWSSKQMKTPIAYRYGMYTFEEIVREATIMNLVGYTIQKNPNVDVNSPAYKTYFSTYSKYTYTPQQSMTIQPDFIGKSATIYVNCYFGEDKVVVEKELKVIFE